MKHHFIKHYFSDLKRTRTFLGEPTFIIWPLAIFLLIEKVKAVLTTWFMTWMYRFFSTLKNAFRQQNTNRSKRRFSVEEEENCLFPSNACFAAKYWYNILSFFSAQKRALSCIQWRLLCSIEKWKCRRENAGETFANLIPILKGRGCCQ